MATEEVSKPPSLLPPYPEMILAAIDSLDDKNGSNKSAISKYIESKHGELPPAHASLLAAHLTRMKESGELVFLKNNYFRADSPQSPPKRGRGRPPKVRDPNAPTPPPKPVSTPSPGGSGRPRGRPPKAKDPLADAVAKASSGTPKARGRPPSKAKTDAPADAAAAAPAPGAPVTGVKRGRGRPPKPRPEIVNAA